MGVFMTYNMFNNISKEYASGKRIPASIKFGFKKSYALMLDIFAVTFVAGFIMLLLCPPAISSVGAVVTIGSVVYTFFAILINKVFADWYARIEGKNGEMKRFHGLARARGYGLISVSFQAKLTVIAVNLKRISRLISPLKPDNQINLLDLGKKYRIIFFKLELGSLIVKISLKNATFSVVSDG